MDPSSQSKKTFWYGRKAMAAYALAGLVIAFLGLLFGEGLLRHFVRESATHLVAEIGPPERERVLVAKTVEELRSTNDVRPLRYEEQSMDINRLSGVYGFTLASFFEGRLRASLELLHKITLQNEQERYSGIIEIHKTDNGKVMIVGYVDPGSVAIASDTSKAVGSLYLYHEPVREGQIPIAIPASRIIDWDYRAPHEFSEIKMD